MANKALATRQRMQFRVEPSQAPTKGRGNQARKALPDYLTAKRNNQPLPLPATVRKTPDSQEET
ncbi:hypothetical protein ACO0LF_07935 [Undibacterium sp. Di27W]|uniref:hypothetical protein n=1 Tax=Undibacterium sp. Di27W TaxID=3413036 RepID=UPI003BF1546F